MKNLFKYELRKTLVSKLILAALAVLVEAFFLVSLFQNSAGRQAVAMGILVALGIIGVLFIGIQSLITLHRDMNTRQGYMLFMTPNSGYKILGAKVLENACSVLLTGIAFFALGTLNFYLMTRHSQDVTETIHMLKDLVSSLGENISFNFTDIAFLILNTLIDWLSVVTLAYFADILISSVLNGKKFSGLLGFILFLILSYVVNKIGSFLPDGNSLAVKYGIGIVYYALIVVLTYFGSAKLMERHLSI